MTSGRPTIPRLQNAVTQKTRGKKRVMLLASAESVHIAQFKICSEVVKKEWRVFAIL